MKHGLLLIGFLLFFACNAGQGIAPEQKTKPIEITIVKSFDKVYQTTAEILSEYNFPIQNSDNTLGIITTDFIQYKTGAKGFLYGALAGMRDFMMQINIKVIRINEISCRLRISGKMKYSREENIFKSSEKVEPIKVGSDSYKQMQKMAKEIKLRAETT